MFFYFSLFVPWSNIIVGRLWRKSPFGLISGIVSHVFDKLDAGEKKKIWENEEESRATYISISSPLGRIQRFVDLAGFGRSEQPSPRGLVLGGDGSFVCCKRVFFFPSAECRLTVDSFLPLSGGSLVQGVDLFQPLSNLLSGGFFLPLVLFVPSSIDWSSDQWPVTPGSNVNPDWGEVLISSLLLSNRCCLVNQWTGLQQKLAASKLLPGVDTRRKTKYSRIYFNFLKYFYYLTGPHTSIH